MKLEEDAPPSPTPSADVPWQDWSEVPRFGVRYRHLSRAALGGHYHVGVAIEELAPGMQSSPAHWHVFEEEHVFMLEGSLTARIGSGRHEMKAGDYVCFPASQQAGHCLVNDTAAVCRYVIVGERNRKEVVVYTDSDKVLLRPLGRRALFDLGATRTYWDGENTGLPAGASPPAEPSGFPADAEITPFKPISSEHVGWRDEGPPGSTRFGGRSRHLTEAAVGPDYRVGMVIEAPAPGRRPAPRHYHMLEEEHALILEGQVTLLYGDRRFDMRPGDHVCFPAGRKVGHSFMNGGTGPCSYLMIGEHNPNEVCVYPDSNKIMVRALRSRHDVFDMSGTRGYWDGE
jgi:uncharacterized cupin superfamily protein